MNNEQVNNSIPSILDKFVSYVLPHSSANYMVYKIFA